MVFKDTSYILEHLYSFLKFFKIIYKFEFVFSTKAFNIIINCYYYHLLKPSNDEFFTD